MIQFALQIDRLFLVSRQPYFQISGSTNLMQHIMKVIWISNGLYPDVCEKLGLEVTFTGGWQFSGAVNLKNTIKNVQLAIVSPYEGVKLQTIEINDITYYLVPKNAIKHPRNNMLESCWKEIQNRFHPDLVHIHGTEYPFLSSYINFFGIKNVVVSIQGLVSVYSRYYFGGIVEKRLWKNITIRDMIRRDSIFKQYRQFQKKGEIEKGMIRSVNHIIGRTTWDKAHVWAMNPHVNYHFCNETLRNEFYEHTWRLSDCEKYSIFLSQGDCPIKGLQQMIQALPIILDHFPDAKVYVAGNNFVTNRGWRLNGYGKYIKSLMKEKRVSDKIVFTGILAEKEMCERFLSSHVFICPSSIENSPNSVGEAQLIGIPCIAAYVGGISDMVKDNESGLLYRYEETEMLAASVCHLFSNDQLAEKLSRKSKEIANIRHDQITNTNTLFTIYESICKNL